MTKFSFATAISVYPAIYPEIWWIFGPCGIFGINDQPDI